MNKSKLKFAFNFSAVQIIFANGKESDFYDTKDEAIVALIECFHKKKIAAKDMPELFEEILIQNNLKWMANPIKFIQEITPALKEIGIGVIVVNTLDGKEINRHDYDSDQNDVVDFDTAHLRLCPHCGKHARIVTTTEGKETQEFATKMDGITLLDELRSDGYINKTEYILIKKEIMESGLLDENQASIIRIGYSQN